MARRLKLQHSTLLAPLTERETDILRLIIAGLSNHEIGLQLCLTVGTVKWYNYKIFSKLGVRSRTEAVAKALKLRLFGDHLPFLTGQPKYMLPVQSTAFVGRSQELGDIMQRMNDPDCRLLSLIGPGGIGKTRLAIQAASQLLPQFADGVVFVPLEALTSPDQVITAIAQACQLNLNGAEMGQRLWDFLDQKHLLLVLDNFEHLLEVVPKVLALLEAAKHVRMIVTTRIPLHLRSEWVIAVQGLSLLDKEETPAQDPYASDAIRLFMDCARRAGIALSLETELPHIVQICRLVQASPLAIELAASWLRTLTCSDIAQALNRNSDLLASPLQDIPERHHSLRQVFQSSWNLLTPNEQETLRALAIFQGGFTSEALYALTGAALSVLARLVDHSLVQVVGNGRYTMHPLIQQYADEHLETSGDRPLISRTHAVYYAEFLSARRRDLIGGQQLLALNAIQDDFENVRAAWCWLVDHQDFTTLEKVWESLNLFVDMRWRGSDLFRYARAQFALTSLPPHHPVMSYLLVLHLEPGEDYEAARIQALSIADHHSDTRARAFALVTFEPETTDWAAILDAVSESYRLFQELGELYYQSINLHDLNFCYGILGATEKQNAAIEACVGIRRQIGDRHGLGSALHELASHEFFQGDHAAAELHFRESFAISSEFGDRYLMLFAGQACGQMRYLVGDFEAAWIFFQDALLIAEDLGGVWSKLFLVLRGYRATAEGNYLAAADYFQTSLEHSFNPYVTAFINWGYSVAACGLQRYPLAKERLAAAFEFALRGNNLAVLGFCLPTAVMILWHESQKDLAVQVLALWFSHPAAQQGWFVSSPLGKPLLARMKADFSGFESAWELGIKRDLQETAAALQALFV